MSNELRHTPLHGAHRRLGARMVPFAGYEMPIQYPDGITAEHRRVREAVGLFDVSHMGTVEIAGPEALECVQRLTTNDASKLAIGAAQYTLLLTETGGILDDLLAFRTGDDSFLLVVNAANREADLAAMRREGARFEVGVNDTSGRTAIIAVQGPKAEEVLQPIAEADLSEIGFYRFLRTTVAGQAALVSRTGYTGEDGFELYLDAEAAEEVWETVLSTEMGVEVGPAGLGARDTLRLEVGYPLHGNDIDASTGPYAASLGWTVKLDKGDFVGREAAQREKETGPERKLAGFRLLERGFPRAGYPVAREGEEIGRVTSGAVSPSIGDGIGLAYLPTSIAKPGERIDVMIRDRAVAAEVVRPPFYTEGSLRR